MTDPARAWLTLPLYLDVENPRLYAEVIAPERDAADIDESAEEPEEDDGGELAPVVPII